MAGMRLTAWGLGLGALLVSASSAAIPGLNVKYTAGGGELTVTSDEGSRTQTIDCSGTSTLVHKEKLYIACGEGGVLIFSLADPLQPTVSARWPVDGVALEVTADGDDVYVRTQTITNKPLKPAPRTTFAPWTPPPTSFSQKDCPTWEAPPRKPSKWPNIMAPPRRLGASLGSELHGFVPLGSVGMGVALEAHVAVRIPWVSVHAHLWPLATTFDNKGNLLATSAMGIVAIDTEYFEIGVGAGGMTFNPGPRPNSAFLLSTLTRVGTVDGLAFTAWLELFAADRGVSAGMPVGAASDFSGFRGVFQIPLSERIVMLVRGAGTVAGWGTGDLALRYRFRGEGGRGSLYGLVGVGGYGVVFAGNAQVGPSISVGVEWRP